MASSDRRPSYARRFTALAAFIILAIIVYTAGWYWLAGQIHARAANAITALKQEGAEVACAEQSVRGYPFRIGVFCDSVAFAQPEEDISFSASAFRSAAQIYNPRYAVAELDAPARLEAATLRPLSFDWEILRASARLTSALPDRLSAESRGLVVSAELGTAGATPLFTIDDIEAHMRPNAGDLDLALGFVGLTLGEVLASGRSVPQLAGAADAAIDDGVALAASGDTSLRGRSGIIRNARLEAGGASLAVAGPFSIGSDGLVDAKLELTVTDPAELSRLAAKALPEFAKQIETVFSGLAALGDTPTLPLTISDGRVSLGFLDLGALPPL